MTTFEFLQLFSLNSGIYILFAIPLIWLYIIIANKITDSWFNPVAINVFTAGIGISVACFLFYMGEASLSSFLHVIISSIIFWGVLIRKFPRAPLYINIKIKNERPYAQCLFVIFYSAYIGLTLFSYSSFGIPLFNDDSRLATYQGAGGLGVIQRLTEFFLIYSVFYIFMLFSKKRIKITRLVLLLSPFVIFGILSGSRSSFIIFIFTFWGYNKFYLGETIGLMRYKKLIVLLLAVSLLTFAIEESNNFHSGFIHFMERILACGDLYWYALPNETIQDLSVKAPINDLTVGFLAPMRLMSESSSDMPLGFQLTRLVYQNFDKTTGPVELFTVSGRAYFGYWCGFMFVAFQALCACLFYRLFYKQSDSLIVASFLFFSFRKCTNFLASFRNEAGDLFDILLNLAVVFILCMLLALLKGGKRISKIIREQ